MPETKRSRRSRSSKVSAEKTTRVMAEQGGKDDKTVLRDEEDREVHRFGTDPAYVRVSAGQTISTGNYESLRVDVAITMPCYKENVDETFENVAEDVANKLSSEVEKWIGA